MIVHIRASFTQKTSDVVLPLLLYKVTRPNSSHIEKGLDVIEHTSLP